MKTKNKLFPIFLKLSEIHILLVGGGAVALEKLTGIYRADPDAKVSIVADFLRQEIIEMVGKMSFSSIAERKFLPTDIVNKNLVILATDNRQLHEEVKKLCKEQNILCNVADTPDLCDFYLSSVVQKGDLKIAISTNGKSPTVAKRLREVFEETFPDEIEDVLDNLHSIRKNISGDFSEKVKKLNELTKILTEKETTDG